MQLQEGNISVVNCIDEQGLRPGSGLSHQGSMGGALKKVINGYLETIALADLVESFRRHQDREYTYVI